MSVGIVHALLGVKGHRVCYVSNLIITLKTASKYNVSLLSLSHFLVESEFWLAGKAIAG